jgi:hypothetical protein
MFGIFGRMDERRQDRTHTLISIKADAKTFPAELWQRFKQTADARGEKVIDVLRRCVEQYVSQERRP